MNTYLKTLSIALLTPVAINAATLLIDFGSGSLQTTGQPQTWNNIVIGAATVGVPQSLVTTTGAATGLTLSYSDYHIGSGVNGANVDGTTSPTGAAAAYPASATRDSLFGNTTFFSGDTVPSITILISGLSSSEMYSFTYFASRSGVSDNRSSNYTLTNGTETSISILNASNNTSATVSSSFLAPAPDGTLTLTVTRDASNNNSSGFYYLGVLEITTAAIPEPGTYAALAGALVLATVAVRRRRHT